MATYEHEKGGVTIKANAYEQNYYTHGIREAIEIKRLPNLNENGGRYNLSII